MFVQLKPRQLFNGISSLFLRTLVCSFSCFRRLCLLAHLWLKWRQPHNGISSLFLHAIICSFSFFCRLCLLVLLSEPLHHLLCMGVWCSSCCPLGDWAIFKVVLEVLFTLQYTKFITSWSSALIWRLWSVWIESQWWLLWNYAVETCVFQFTGV